MQKSLMKSIYSFTNSFYFLLEKRRRREEEEGKSIRVLDGECKKIIRRLSRARLCLCVSPRMSPLRKGGCSSKVGMTSALYAPPCAATASGCCGVAGWTLTRLVGRYSAATGHGRCRWRVGGLTRGCIACGCMSLGIVWVQDIGQGV